MRSTRARSGTSLVVCAVAIVLAACGGRGDAPSDASTPPEAAAPRPVISVLHPYTGDDDVTGLRRLLDAFMLINSDVTVLEEGVRDVAATLAARQAEGAAPDVVVLSPLGAFPRLVDEGTFRPLDRIIDVDLLASELAAGLLDLGRARGALYAVPLRVDVSSLVWFNPTLFAAQSYAVPASWDELTVLSDRMVADGIVPWCIGIEAGAATGWLASEWMADVLLRVDVDLYDRWVTGELGSSAEEVEQALEAFLVPIWTDDARVLGGRGAIATTFVGTSVGGILGAQPGCAMSRQGTAAEVLLLDLAPGAVFGVDYDVFLLPGRTAADRPVLGAVDQVALLSDEEAAERFVKFLATPAAAGAWAEVAPILSPFVAADVAADGGAGAGAPERGSERRITQLLADATTFRLTAASPRPTRAWPALTAWIAGETTLREALETIDGITPAR